MTSAPPGDRRPNILFLLSDDHAAHSISAYGSVLNTTPHIDAIGEAGVRFENLFATNSLCSPSRASLLTGTYSSHVNGVSTLDTFIDATQPTFVTALQDAGYRTGFVGKWHLGDGETEGVSHDPHGFDYWDALIDQGEYHDPGSSRPTACASNPATRPHHRPRNPLARHARRSRALVPAGLAQGPHRPWDPDDAHTGMYAGSPIPVPGTFADDMATRSDTARRAHMSVADDLTEVDLKQPVPQGLSRENEALWKYQRYMEDYSACVASVDDNVGRLVGWLRDHGDLDDTMLLYGSDQGFFLGDHGWFDKRFMYEESIRMPFLVSYPRAVPAGTTHTGIVSNVDVAQTLLEAAGVPAHPRMQGRSFWPDIAGTRDPDPPHDGLYYRYWMHDDRSHHVGAHYGLRTDRYCLVYFYNDGLGVPGCSDERYPAEWELYDLAEDPQQLRNIADDPAYASVRAGLERRLWCAQAAVEHAPPRPAQTGRPP